jgi:putative protein-disulfide isomerase
MTSLYYVHDPMCSWCYAFAPVWERIRAALPASFEVEYVLGGLAPDTDEPMPAQMRVYIQQTWRRIEAAVPGTVLNFDFWARNTPRRSTYPACRAVLTAAHFDPALERPMIAAIQRAYYREARNPADVETLVALGAGLGLDTGDFRERLSSDECEAELRRNIARARELGVQGFPSLVLGTAHGLLPISHSYTDPNVTLRTLEAVRSAPASPAKSAHAPGPG